MYLHLRMFAVFTVPFRITGTAVVADCLAVSYEYRVTVCFCEFFSS
jgi:uncharacterized membrane protein